MKTLKENMIKYAVILMLIIIAFILGRCGKEKNAPLMEQQFVYIKDTTTYTGNITAPVGVNQGVKYVIRWKTMYDTITNLDTVYNDVVIIDSTRCMEIAEDYYSTYAYDRTIVDDSNLTVRLLDTTYMNAIQSSRYEYKINRPQTIIINRPQRPVTIYSGVNMFYSKENGFSPTVGVHIVTNKLTMFYGVGNKCQNAGIYFKLY